MDTCSLTDNIATLGPIYAVPLEVWAFEEEESLFACKHFLTGLGEFQTIFFTQLKVKS